jgi:hypothetical protein
VLADRALNGNSRPGRTVVCEHPVLVPEARLRQRSNVQCFRSSNYIGDARSELCHFWSTSAPDRARQLVFERPWESDAGISGGQTAEVDATTVDIPSVRQDTGEGQRPELVLMISPR